MARANDRSCRSPTLIDAPRSPNTWLYPRQPSNDPIGAHARRCRGDMLLGDRVRQPDVGQHVACEEKDVLLDVADTRTELFDRNRADVDAIEEDDSALRVVKAQQEVDDRCFSGAGMADQGESPARLDFKAHALENPLR